MESETLKKKKILFICSNMSIGGFQKSLINLLMFFDYEKYDVTLYLVHKEGIFLDYINPHVRVITNEVADDYCYDYKKAIKKLLKNKRLWLAVKRTINLIISLKDKGNGAVYMSRQMPKINGRYDICIDYNGQYINYFMVDRIKARKKITYFHSDYSKWSYYLSSDKKYFKYDDQIVTVSDECVESLKRFFPEYSKKIVKIENIVSPETVNSLINIKEGNTIEGLPRKKWVICTVGRVCDDKGTDIAIEACKRIKEEIGDDFLWIWVGPGEDNPKYMDMVVKNRVQENIVFVGQKLNPYVYMDLAQLIVHPSRFEGKAVAVEEALVMHKPILATNYSTVGNQIQDGVTGIVVDMNAEAVADGVASLIQNEGRLVEIAKNQQNICKGNADEIYRLYEIIE